MSAHYGGGRLSNSAGGVGEKPIFGKPRPGRITAAPSRTRPSRASPGSTIRPTRISTSWHVRDDGWMSAAFCLRDAYQLERASPLRLRYGFHIHARALDAKIAERGTRSLRRPRGGRSTRRKRRGEWCCCGPRSERYLPNGSVCASRCQIACLPHPLPLRGFAKRCSMVRRLDIHPGKGIGAVRHGMRPAEVLAVFDEPQVYEYWMGGNLNDARLFMVCGCTSGVRRACPPYPTARSIGWSSITERTPFCSISHDRVD